MIEVGFPAGNTKSWGISRKQYWLLVGLGDKHANDNKSDLDVGSSRPLAEEG